jgi:pimeloyl-ACP methyl ester carboxylesterase
MVTAMAALIVIASVGALVEDISVVRDQHAYAAPGRTYDVSGHDLYLDCRGQGSPTVLLFNGLGEVAASWVRIIDETDTHTRVCAYDRAGQGWSGDTDPQDGVTAAHDLHLLLREAGEHGPFVLAGHSTGGTYALTYAARYPQQVAGMVLLDSSSPYQFTAMPSYPLQYAAMRRGLALLPTLDRLGLGRLMAAVQPSHLPQPAADVVESLTATAHGARNGRDEISMAPEVFAQAQALTTLHDRPLAVLTASESVTGTAGWATAQDRLAALSSDSVHRLVDATHAGMTEDRGPAQQSADAIAQVVHAVRAGTDLDGS